MATTPHSADPGAHQLDDASARVVVSLLETISAQLAELVTAVRAINTGDHGQALNASDREALGRILPAVAATCSFYCFTGRELLEHARLPSRQDLANALRGGSGNDEMHTPRTLGQLFKRGRDVAIDGRVLRQVGKGRDGAVWLLEGGQMRVDVDTRS